MKNLFIVMIFAIALTSCDNKKNDEKIIHHDLVVMIDNTEGGLYSWDNVLKMEDISNLFTLNGKQMYGSVTFTDINNISMNRTQSVKLFEPIPYKDGSTELLRKMRREENQKELVNSFLQVSELYKTFVSESPSEVKENSILFSPISKAINRLGQSSADHKTLIVLSDMIENSECGNFYKATTDNYKKVIKDLESCTGITLTPNSGVKVIILFQTGSPKQDRLFTKSMEIWDLIFKKANISYEVLPNL